MGSEVISTTLILIRDILLLLQPLTTCSTCTILTIIACTMYPVALQPP